MMIELYAHLDTDTGKFTTRLPGNLVMMLGLVRYLETLIEGELLERSREAELIHRPQVDFGGDNR